MISTLILLYKRIIDMIQQMVELEADIIAARKKLEEECENCINKK